MREELHTLCQNFIRNRDVVKSTFGWESTYIYPVSAAIFTDKRMTADADRLRRCKDILKEHTGVFSNFRSTTKLPMLSMMAADSNPERRLQNALEVYGLLKEYFWNSQYLTLTAMVIADLTEGWEYKNAAVQRICIIV